MIAAVFLCFLALPFISAQNEDIYPLEPKSNKIYYFANGDECLDSCDFLYGGKFKWCYTVMSSWRECSESGESSIGSKCVDGGCDTNNHCYDKPNESCSLTRLRKALHKTMTNIRCLSDCKKYQNTEYNWCRYNKGGSLSWDKCSAKEGYTVTDQKCNGPCTFRTHVFSASRYMCQRADGTDEECSPVESSQSCVVRNHNRTILVGLENAQYDMSGAGGPICFVTVNDDDRKRRKRSRKSIKDICWNARNSLMCGSDQSLQNMQNARDLLVIQSNMFIQPTPGVGDLAEIRPNDEDNPITSVLRRQIRPDVFRTEYVEADIHHRHTGRPRQPFTGPTTAIDYFRTQLNALNDDDRGHLVPAAMGGVSNDYNIAPQNLAVNRPGGGYLQTLWSEMERRMREFFQTGGPGANGEGHIQYRVMMDYPNETTGRPSAFWVVVNFIFPNSVHNTYFSLLEIYALNNVIMRTVQDKN